MIKKGWITGYMREGCLRDSRGRKKEHRERDKSPKKKPYSRSEKASPKKNIKALSGSMGKKDSSHEEEENLKGEQQYITSIIRGLPKKTRPKGLRRGGSHS